MYILYNISINIYIYTIQTNHIHVCVHYAYMICIQRFYPLKGIRGFHLGKNMKNGRSSPGDVQKTSANQLCDA